MAPPSGNVSERGLTEALPVENGKPSKDAGLVKTLLTYAILAVVLVGVYALLHARLRVTKAELARLQDEAKQQALLSPLVAELRLRAQHTFGDSLTVSAGVPMAQKDMPELEQLFRAPADDLGLVLESIRPDVMGLKGNYNHLSVTVSVSGSLAQMREYLLRMCQLPPLHRLQSVRLVRRAADHAVLIVDLELMVAQRKA